MKELLVRYIEGNCTEQEKADIANWLDSEPEHLKEYLALRKLHDITIWQTNPEQQSGQKAKEKPPVWLWNSFYREALKVAAVFVLAILVSHYFLFEFKPATKVALQTLYVPSGQRAEITLEDGTRVWLNAKSKLIFPNQFSGKTREVELDGEGFFEVTHNKIKPFIVNTEKYNVRVWGTKFNLIAYSGKDIFETSLLEGSVEILKHGSSKGEMIKPNERIYLENNRMVIGPIVDVNHFLWKDGIISFDNETFPEMAKRLELYFDLKVVLKNTKILNYRCTGKFRTKDGVEHILKVLQLSNEFSYVIDDKQNIITIE